MPVTVAAVQMSMTDDVADNVATAERLVRAAAASGAQIILIPELFEGLYFCVDQLPEHFGRARPLDDHPTVDHFRAWRPSCNVVLPISVFERAGQATFNTVVIVDADGSVLGTYRKSHIPDGPGYTEKYYFNPGDTGFRVWGTRARHHRRRHLLGSVVPRSRSMHGAGWAPNCCCTPRPSAASRPRPTGTRAVTGSASCRVTPGANLMPIVAANRVGFESGLFDRSITFYGSSFIADATGAKVAEAGRDDEAVLIASFDLDDLRTMRNSWGLFRDRRPDLYRPLLTLDGTGGYRG